MSLPYLDLSRWSPRNIHVTGYQIVPMEYVSFHACQLDLSSFVSFLFLKIMLLIPAAL